MGIFDWFKKVLGGGDPAVDDSAASDVIPQPHKETKPAPPPHKQDPSATYREPRLQPKRPLKNYWDTRPRVFEEGEAGRLFSASMRTRNKDLRTRAANVARLEARGLPKWTTQDDIADDLGVTRGVLYWLACHRWTDTQTHYIQFDVPKRSGGTRTIMAPKRRLKAVQRRLLKFLVGRLAVTEHAHGFVAGRSVKTNAEPHVGKRVVIRFDLQDFFGTVTFARVRGFLIAQGYGFDVATTLALLMTEAIRQPVEVDGTVVYVPVGHRSCVQGAPTSPAMCNAIAAKLDRRLAGLAAANGFVYTRYADDLTLSGDDESRIGHLLRRVGEIVADEGFALNTKKTRVMRSGGRQRVTGVTVNKELGLSRKERRRLRAKIHKLGPGCSADERDQLRGQLAYLRMLNPDQADALQPDWL
jgi:hypothetical protein